MQKNLYFPMTLLAAALFAGCSSVPQNSSLSEAQSSYNNAQTNPQVTSLAAVELQQAGDTLTKANTALNKGESDAKVNQLAYIAKQQVSIAEETAKQRADEATVANAGKKRDAIRLDARTAEADAANQKVIAVQQTADQQAAALAVASDKAESDKALIAQQDMQLQELHAKKTDRGMVITLSDVLFSTNQARLAPRGVRNIQKLSAFLNQYPQRKVLIEGYTDSTGGDKLNQALSERRADTVRTALLENGINSDRIATHGYGEAFPVASNGTAASRQLNRRVEIILSDDNGNIVPR
ncbi:MAG: OmpA family protein [Sulfuriferula sp.]|nr:OmpA family protein [Sulfuriferula sp.]